MILQGPELVFYSDHKIKEVPGAKPLSTFLLLHATISSKEKDKKKNAFQVHSLTHLMTRPLFSIGCNVKVVRFKATWSCRIFLYSDKAKVQSLLHVHPEKPNDESSNVTHSTCNSNYVLCFVLAGIITRLKNVKGIGMA